MESNNQQRQTVLLFGAIIGAVIGVLAANLLLREAEENSEELALSPTRGMKIGMSVLGFLRSLTN